MGVRTPALVLCLVVLTGCPYWMASRPMGEHAAGWVNHQSLGGQGNTPGSGTDGRGGTPPGNPPIVVEPPEWHSVRFEDIRFHSLSSSDIFYSAEGKTSEYPEFAVFKAAPGTTTFGRVDGSSADVPAGYIGETDAGRLVHVIRFVTAPGFYRITYRLVNVKSELLPVAANMYSATVGAIRTAPGVFQIDVRTQTYGAVLLIDVGRTDAQTLSTASTEIDAIAVECLAPAPQYPRLEMLRGVTATWTPSFTGDPVPVTIPSNAEHNFAQLFGKALVWEKSTIDSTFLHFDGEFSLTPLKDAMREVFGGLDVSPWTPEQRCLELLAYVTQKMRLEPPTSQSDQSDEKIHEVAWLSGSYELRQGYGNCYFRSMALVSLIRMAGLPARQVALPNADHVLMEAYYDGMWHMFDPTYGFFCYSTGKYDGTGHIVSMDELRFQGAPQYPVFGTVPTSALWQGYYSDPASVYPVPRDWRSPNEVPAVPDWMAYYTTAPITSSPGGTPYFAGLTWCQPVVLNFMLSDSLEVGKIDGNIYDTVRGLGRSREINSVHALLFRNAARGRYAVTYKFLEENVAHMPAIVEVFGAKVIRSEMYDKQMWRFEIDLSESDAIVFVDLIRTDDDYAVNAWALDAIHVSKLP